MEERKEEAPVASTRKPQVTQPSKYWKKNRKKNCREAYSPSERTPSIQKDAMDNVFNLARPLIELKDKYFSL
ncbi:hypothetical protein O181_041254 [Austropuccinia psidii MF-1]|uniref:Uncharacterized protein n=1 Tax=Austropuccinia psidii MF-1 TaxID=1389203 RepID=A0A9Q3DE23_9BASI|nr:hypothetical protein [Austropuccinia psidii MF-1]